MKNKISGYDAFIRESTTPSKDSAITRAIEILFALSSSPEPLSAIKIAEKLKISKASIHRIMVHLESIGILERELGSKKFITGQRLNALSIETLINSPNKSIRHSILESLVNDLRETCNITALAGSKVIYIDRVESQWPLRIHLQPGSMVPIHCGASGKLFLSYMPAEQRRRVLNSIALVKYTEHTVINIEKIEKELKKIRKQNYGLDIEEFMQGLIGIAVPIFNQNSKICGTVSIHIPTVRHDLSEAIGYIPKLRIAAEKISQTFSLNI
jgi:DNA-binding IclR family transcriptional regulator